MTIGVGKHYSLGLDLEWMARRPLEEVVDFASESQKVLARLLTFPLVTVAALNGKSRYDTFGVNLPLFLLPLSSIFLSPPPLGHTYAAGAFIAICHDHMMMRDQKGWFCFPEVKISRDFSVGYMNLAKLVFKD